MIIAQRREIENIQKQNTLSNQGIVINLQNKNQLLENKIVKMNEIIQKLQYNVNLTEPILVGLDNIGATCYMNATLQCFSNTSKLTQYFLNKFKNIKEAGTKLISSEYYNVLCNLHDIKNNHKSYAPESFKNAIGQENPLFLGVQANDSKDLINFLLERFHQELNIKTNNLTTKNHLINPNYQLDEKKMLSLFFEDFQVNFHSIISDLFYGVMETKSQCQGCGNIRYNFQVYSFLEFPLEQVNNFCIKNGLRNNNFNSNNIPNINLNECFLYNQNLEMMTSENKMYCNTCKNNCNALYGTILYLTPYYLIINLNRGKGATYQCNVIFPKKLNLWPFVTSKEEDSYSYYELYAVICHIGPSSMSGHFVAYCKNEIDKKWYIYNDSIVQACKKDDEYKVGMPYILFYKAL